MKNFSIFTICMSMLVLLLPITAAHGQDGFTGPRTGSGNMQAQRVTVSEIANLPHNTPVILQGKIVVSTGKETYTFRDATGEITIEIDRKVWRGLTVNENDTVEISGKLEKKVFRNPEIEVKLLTKM